MNQTFDNGRRLNALAAPYFLLGLGYCVLSALLIGEITAAPFWEEESPAYIKPIAAVLMALALLNIGLAVAVSSAGQIGARGRRILCVLALLLATVFGASAVVTVVAWLLSPTGMVAGGLLLPVSAGACYALLAWFVMRMLWPAG